MILLSSSLFVLHFIRSSALLSPSGSLVMPACFIALYSVSKPPASLCSSIRPHTIRSQLHLSQLSLRTHFFPPSSFPLSPVFTPSICLITRSSPLSLFSLFVFPSRLLFLTSYPSSLFVPPPPSVIPSSSSPSVSVYGSRPRPAAWLTNGLSLQRRHITISRPLYLTSHSYLIAVILAECCWWGDTAWQTCAHTYRCSFFFSPFLDVQSLLTYLIIIWAHSCLCYLLIQAQSQLILGR